MSRKPNAEPAFQAAEKYILDACRCLAAAGLVDHAIAAFLREAAQPLDPQTYDTAASVLAEHCASIGFTPAATARLVAGLGIEIAAWPDPQEIAAIVRHAYREDDE